jgi:O-antigen ligase
MEIRFPLNRIALRVIKDNLVFGVGLNNYEQISYKYVQPEDTSDMFPYEQLLQVVHNSYLLIMAETGIPGFLFFVWFLVILFNHGRKVLRIRNSFISNIGLGLLTGLLAYLATLLSGPDYYHHQIMMVFWIIGGYLVTLSKIKIRHPQKILEKLEVSKPVPIGQVR